MNVRTLAVTVLALFFSIVAWGQHRPGAVIEPLKRGARAQLGVQYAYEDGLKSFSLTTSVATSALPPKRPLEARFWDGKENRFTSDWHPVSLPAESTGEEIIALSIQGDEALETIKSLPHLVVVFSSDRATLEGRLELRAFCKTSRWMFDDMTAGRKGCSRP